MVDAFLYEGRGLGKEVGDGCPVDYSSLGNPVPRHLARV